MKLTNMVLSKSKIIIFVCVVLIISGVYSYINIPKQKMPDIVPPVGSYQIVVPGYSAEEVYDYVVKPVEQAILSIEDVDSVMANAFDNFAIVNIILDIRYPNPEEKWVQISQKLNEIDLPSEVMDPTFRSLFDFPHVVYSVTSKTANVQDIELIAQKLATEIRNIDEIKSVDINGLSKKELQISIDVNKLNEYPITINNINDILIANGMNVPVGKINNERSAVNVEAPMLYENIEDIENLLIGMTMPDQQIKVATPIFLKDIAQVQIVDTKEDRTYYAHDSQAVFVSAYFKNGLDFTKLGDDLTFLIEDFNEDNEDYDIGTLVFQPDYVSSSMDQVNKSLVQGLIFVMIIILIGLGFRNAISVAFTFPLIIFATVLILFITGQELHIISITGLIITIGIIVDNSIVISDSIQYYLDQGEDKKKAISLAVKKNARPVLFATLTTIAAFTPLILLPGTIGKMMFGLPLTVVIAITLSYVVAMIVTPVLGGKLYRKKTIKHRKEKKIKIGILTKAVHGSMKRPALVMLVCVVLLIASLTTAIIKQPFKFFPTAEESIIYINYEYTGAQEQKTVDEYAKEIVNIVKTYDDVEYLTYSVGGDLPRFDNSVSSLSELPTTGRIYARFNIPYSEMQSVRRDIEKDLEFAQVDGIVTVQELMFAPISEEIKIVLSSEDMDETVKVAEKVEEELQNIDGIKSYNITYPSYQEKFIVELDRNKILQNGTVAADVQMQIRDYLASTTSAEYLYNDEKIDISLKTNVDSLVKLSNSGIYIQSQMRKLPLNEFGEITSSESLYTVSTQDGKFLILISINAEYGVDTTLLQIDIDNAIGNIDNADVSIAYGGEKEIIIESLDAMAIAAIIALIIIYLIMLIQFNSFLQPIIILVTIPLSLIGSGIAAVVFNANISFTVIFGAIALMGIVVNSGILLIDYINKAREKGVELKKACYESVERRIRPIILSSITTIFGLIPLALYGGEFFNPMAVTLIGGLAISTLLTIFVIPALYYMIEKRHKDRKLNSKHS